MSQYGYSTAKGFTRKDLVYLLFVIPLVPIEGLFYINRSLYYVLFLAGSAADALVIGLLWIRQLINTGKKTGAASVAILMLAIYNIMLTVCKHGDLWGGIGMWFYMIPAVLLIELKRNRLDRIMRVLLIWLETLIIVNFMLTLAFPRGMISGDMARYGKMWILGYKSSLQCYVFPAVLISLMFSAYTHHYININTFFLLAVSHAVCISESNSMLLVGLALIDFIVITGLYKRNVISKRAVILSALVILAANIIIVIFTSSFLSNPAVQYVLFSLLGKNPTLSLRTSNWKAVLPAIQANPIFGHGYTSDAVRIALYKRDTAHAHNLFLELLYESGTIGFIMFFFFNYTVFRKVYRKFKYASSRVIFYGLGIFYVMYIFENPFQKTSSFLWILFLIGYYTDIIDTKLKKSHDKTEQYV